MKAYLVFEEGGCYEDRYCILRNAFFDKQKAEKLVENFNNKRDKLKLTSDDWMEWYDKLDEIYPCGDLEDDFDWAENDERFVELIKKHFPDASLKYSDSELKEIFNYNMGAESYDDPFYKLKEIEIEE